MSADNWARCPRCHARALAEFEKREKMIEAAYGQVSIEEFDLMRERLDNDREKHENARETFREDYEFFGADQGVVTAKYSGECNVCGLKLKFEENHEIPGVED